MLGCKVAAVTTMILRLPFRNAEYLKCFLLRHSLPNQLGPGFGFALRVAALNSAGIIARNLFWTSGRAYHSPGVGPNSGEDHGCFPRPDHQKALCQGC